MAAVLSFFWPGLGHVYAGKIFQGLFFFLLCAVVYPIAVLAMPVTAGISLLAAFLLHIFVMIDAKRASDRKRKAELQQMATMLKR